MLDRVRASAGSLIRKIGKPAVFKRLGSVAYDTETGAVTESRVQWSQYVIESAYYDKERIREGRRFIATQAGDKEPAIGDIITVDGVDYEIIEPLRASLGVYDIYARPRP